MVIRGGDSMFLGGTTEPKRCWSLTESAPASALSQTTCFKRLSCMNEPRIKKICNIYGYTGGNMDGTIYATDGLAPAMIVGGCSMGNDL